MGKENLEWIDESPDPDHRSGPLTNRINVVEQTNPKNIRKFQACREDLTSFTIWLVIGV